MMGFALQHSKEGQDVLNLVIDSLLEGCAVSAEDHRGEIDEQAGAGDSGGDDAIVIIRVAHAGAAQPAEEVAGAVADSVFAQGEDLRVLIARGQLIQQGRSNVPAGSVLCGKTVQDHRFHVQVLWRRRDHRASDSAFPRA